MACDSKCPKKNKCFFSECPRQLEYYPTEPCHMGKPKYGPKGNVPVDPECEWWINSEEDNYCWWTYLKRNTHPDGSMTPMMQSEIAKLFGCSCTKIHFILKQALHKLKDSGNLETFVEYYELLHKKESPDPTIPRYSLEDLYDGTQQDWSDEKD